MLPSAHHADGDPERLQGPASFPSQHVTSFRALRTEMMASAPAVWKAWDRGAAAQGYAGSHLAAKSSGETHGDWGRLWRSRCPSTTFPFLMYPRDDVGTNLIIGELKECTSWLGEMLLAPYLPFFASRAAERNQRDEA